MLVVHTAVALVSMTHHCLYSIVQGELTAATTVVVAVQFFLNQGASGGGWNYVLHSNSRAVCLLPLLTMGKRRH